MKVLVPNLGSTSLKYQLLDMDVSGGAPTTTERARVLARGKIERIGSEKSLVTTWDADGKATQTTSAISNHRAAVELLNDFLRGGPHPAGIDAVGFKAVHGGPRYRGSFVVDDDLLAAMQEFVPVAPVHNPI